MKILELEVIGLNKSAIPIKLKFNEDINLITGRNGSGKTTILKLMWYCISANIERAVREIIFERISIATSEYTLLVEKYENKNKELVHVVVTLPNGEILLDKKETIRKEEAVEEANAITVDRLDTSVFFPTFRRIEGGFSMTDSSNYGTRRVHRNGEELIVRDNYGTGSEIQNALEMHASRLSVKKHKFVSSISTADIKELVTRKYNDAATKVDEVSKVLSETIFSEIKKYRQESTHGNLSKNPVSTIDKINEDVIEFEKVREREFKSITVLSDIVVTIFKHKGIRLNPRVVLGDIEHGINSDALSAGEKQMLSFLCYNALYSNCPFFIDEPELSLHVDWQRILLGILIEQKTNNQLFIATHSPFIYTQYEDKEIMIGSDRGFNGE